MGVNKLGYVVKLGNPGESILIGLNERSFNKPVNFPKFILLTYINKILRTTQFRHEFNEADIAKHSIHTFEFRICSPLLHLQRSAVLIDGLLLWLHDH
ncbi:MAG: hypothetical protein CMQ84_10210 [Gammaproteobacteria bacterium]|nr:hypothetical protein [Gammaproteobacteria bacterium]